MKIQNCFVIEARCPPNQYFVGRIGSKWIIAMRDKKKITGRKCDKCGITYIPPREYCNKCGAKIADNWVDVGSTGELVNYTIVNYNDKHLPRKAPYILGQIKLDGADTPLNPPRGRLDPLDSIGMKVRPSPECPSTTLITELEPSDAAADPKNDKRIINQRVSPWPR
jgi:uncharacterized OB-fold protein